MPSVFDGNTHNEVFVSLALIAGVLGSFSSALVILLIYKMKVWNLHIALILGMTLFELLYDVSFFTGMVNTGSFALSVASNLAQLLGGTTSSIISNIIAGVALHVVFYKRSIDLLPYYKLLLGFAILPGIVVCILYTLAVSNSHYHHFADFAVLGLYYYIRLVSICFNFICSVCTAVMIHQMGTLGRIRTQSEIAIRTLSMRLFYYPILQAIGRSGCAWYEMTYKYNFDPDTGFNFNPEDTSDMQFAAQCLMVISTPLISIGYLCIFLIMQPDAKRTLYELLGRPSCWNIDEAVVIDSENSGVVYTRHSSPRAPLLSQQYAHSSSGQLSDVSHTPSVESSIQSNRDVESVMSSRVPSVDLLQAITTNLFED